MKNCLSGFYLPVAAWLCAWVSAAEDVSAEHLVRTGKPAQALQLLREGHESLSPAEACYWTGRALLALGRFSEAVSQFRGVPDSHPLFPYAARGMLFCAKYSPGLDFSVIAKELSGSSNEQVSRLARAFLAQQTILSAKSLRAAIAAYTELEAAAQERKELLAAVKLMGVYIRTRSENYTAGINCARESGNDPSLNTTAHHLLRLLLAELYYEKEKAEQEGPAVSQPTLPESEDEDAPADAYGMGEETLLQFITAHPESPVLREAFSRLRAHVAADPSAYSRNKLSEWASNTAHPRRAAYALLALMECEVARGGDTSILANRAVSDLPGEPLSRLIVYEHIRHLLSEGKTEGLASYIDVLDSMLRDTTDAYTLYLRAMLAEESPEHAAELFERSAVNGSDALRPTALANALICYFRAGNNRAIERLLRDESDPATRQVLLLTHAELLPPEHAEVCLRELEEVRLLSPNADLSTRAGLCELRALLTRDPARVLRELLAFSQKQRAHWSDAEILLYAALLEHAADAADPHDRRRAADLLRNLYDETAAFPLKQTLGFHLAERLSADGRHADAGTLLLDLAHSRHVGQNRELSLFLAARECVACGTLPSLQHAIHLFAECAHVGGSLAPPAIIVQAEILTRINRCRSALDLLEPMQTDSLSPELRAYRLTVLADAYALLHPDADLQRALSTCADIQNIPELPHTWSVRARLQHAILATRAGQIDVAFDDYMDVLRVHDEGGSPLGKSCIPLYYFAGAGAVYCQLCMDHYQEAAELCDHIAQWHDPSASIAPCDESKAAAFTNWAGAIRRTHFLPAQKSQNAVSGAK